MKIRMNSQNRIGSFNLNPTNFPRIMSSYTAMKASTIAANRP